MRDVDQIMTDIIENVPGLTDSEILIIADQIEPLPSYIENLEDSDLLKLLGMREMSEDEIERFFTFFVLPHTKDSLAEIREAYANHPQIQEWLGSILGRQTILAPNYFQKGN